MTKTVCPTCGLKSVEYRHHLSKVVIDLVVKLHERGQPACASELCPGLSERTNSYKNQFWGLIKPYVTPELEIKRGWWELTPMGEEFASGQIHLKKTVITRNSEVLGFEGPLISIKDLLPEYQYVKDWKDQARQQILFEGDE
jgi:hypothetical protein